MNSGAASEVRALFTGAAYRFGVASLFRLAAILVSVGFGQLGARIPFATLYPAVFGAAVLAGLSAGLSAGLIVTLAAQSTAIGLTSESLINSKLLILGMPRIDLASYIVTALGIALIASR